MGCTADLCLASRPLDLPFAHQAVVGLSNFSWHPRRPLQWADSPLVKQEWVDIVDCTFSLYWNLFRHKLQVAAARFGGLAAAVHGCGGHCRRTAEMLRSLASGMVGRYFETFTEQDAYKSMRNFKLYVAELTDEWVRVLSGDQAFLGSLISGENYCAYGLLAVAVYFPDLVLSPEAVIDMILGGKDRKLDFLTSSSWPLDPFDFYLEVGTRGAQPLSMREVFSDASWSSGGELTSLLRPPLLQGGVDPQRLGCSFAGAGCPGAFLRAQALRICSGMAHVALTMEMASLLLEIEQRVTVTIMCPAAHANLTTAQTEGSCPLLCKLAPSLCDSPRLTLDYRESAWDGVYSAADIHLCFTYSDCTRLGRRYAKPTVLYDGRQYGCPWKGLPDPSWDHLRHIRDVIDHDVFVVQRRRDQRRLQRHELSALGRPAEDRMLPEDLPTLFVATDPWHAEAIFFLTGIRVPSVRPSSFYIPCSASREDRHVVYWHDDRGRCIACNVFRRFLLNSMPEGFPLRLMLGAGTEEHLGFCDLGNLRAMVLVPHGNVMQMIFYEASNMALPIFLPDLRLLARQPFFWWLYRMGGDGSSLSQTDRERLTNPPLPKDFERPHPFPFMVPNIPKGIERLKALLYWIRLLPYVHFSWTRHFESLPDLLYGLLQTEDLDRISQELRRFVHAERLQSLAFWRDGLARLIIANT